MDFQWDKSLYIMYMGDWAFWLELVYGHMLMSDGISRLQRVGSIWVMSKFSLLK